MRRWPCGKCHAIVGWHVRPSCSPRSRPYRFRCWGPDSHLSKISVTQNNTLVHSVTSLPFSYCSFHLEVTWSNISRVYVVNYCIMAWSKALHSHRGSLTPQEEHKRLVRITTGICTQRTGNREMALSLPICLISKKHSKVPLVSHFKSYKFYRWIIKIA